MEGAAKEGRAALVRCRKGKECTSTPARLDYQHPSSALPTATTLAAEPPTWARTWGSSIKTNSG